ncbi:MAG: thiazole synthase, partial [Asticcacaulis sp.]
MDDSSVKPDTLMNDTLANDTWTVAGRTFSSRLIVGT